jgi:DNA polymerase-4
MSRTILHIDMNAFFASVEQRVNPQLRGKPIAVGGGISKRSVVAAASYEAKALGVKNGMSSWEAKRICPSLIMVAGDMSKYVYTSKEIIKIFRDYSDLVEVFSIDEAFLDVTLTKHHFGGAIKMARDIKGRIRDRFGLTCTIGIGPNKLLAKLAGELKKPDGLVVINHDDVPEMFDMIPVKELCGVGRKIEVYLAEMGIKTCGDLRRCPEWRLVRRFGAAWGERLYMMGQGRDESPVNPGYIEDEAKSMGHSYTLPKNTMDRTVVKNYLLHLSEQVGRRLRGNGYKGRTIHLYIRHSDFTGFSRQRKLEDYMDDGYDIYNQAAKILDEANLDEKMVRLIGVSLSSLIKDLDQISMLEEKESRKKVIKAMDEVNDKFGEFTLTRASLLKTELHEKVGMVAPRAYKSGLNF